jgi:hypothetical protein
MKKSHRTRRWLFILIAGFAPWIAPAVSASEIWISCRADGIAGTGRRASPFDGGTAAKLDALLPTIPPRSQIHFGAGTFLTTGIQVKDGWRISGLGKDRTTLKLVDGYLTRDTPGRQRSVIFEYDFQGFLHYFELQDLSIDCNRERQPAFQESLRGYSLDAWIIAAKSAKITNVRARGTWANPGEGFPCRVYHDGSRDPADRIEIYGCENIRPLGYLTAISVFDQAGGLVGGFIRHCTVTEHNGGAAFGAGGWRHFSVDHNRIRNVQTGITIDTHDYVDVDISRNHFHNCMRGILCNGSGIYRRISIHDNVFEMAPRTGAPCIDAGYAHFTGQLYRNTVYQRSRAVPIISKGPHTAVVSRDNKVRLTRLPK